ncbi:MAG: glycosyltransferase family 2 protein [Myxococcales bacterium]
MNVSILIGTFGEVKWADLAYERARPSAMEQGAAQVIQGHLPDAGLADVRNMLAEDATGDWLCFLDADDELCPGYVDAMETANREHWADALEGEDDSALPWRALLVPAVGYPGAVPVIPAWGRAMIDVNCCVIGTLVPRDLFHAVGGFRDTLADGGPLPAPGLEDWDFWLRCVLAGARLVPVPAAVYCASGRPGAGSHNMDVYHRIRAEHEAAYRVLQQAGHAP